MNQIIYKRIASKKAKTDISILPFLTFLDNPIWEMDQHLIYGAWGYKMTYELLLGHTSLVYLISTF